MPEVPGEHIEEAESSPTPPHSHERVNAEDGSLGEHLRQVHGLDPAATLSPTTQQGLHDRLHGSSKAADD